MCPPSSTGIGRKLITARFALSSVRKIRKVPNPSRAFISATRMMAQGPERLRTEICLRSHDAMQRAINQEGRVGGFLPPNRRASEKLSAFCDEHHRLQAPAALGIEPVLGRHGRSFAGHFLVAALPGKFDGRARQSVLQVYQKDTASCARCP